MTAALGAQFQGYTGGPGEAHQKDWEATRFAKYGLRSPEEEDPDYPVQRHLFDPESVALPEAHQQTPEQFAKDPRTWWHGRFTGEKSRLSGGGTREGFHAGTQGAARVRLAANAARHAEKPGVSGHLFPLRITGPVGSEIQEEPEAQKKSAWGKGGSIVHTALGPGGAAHEAGRGYLYRNAVEAAGSISVGVPQRKGFLSTHREMVENAQRRGEYVHPLIAWAARKGREHTGEEVPRKRKETPEGFRYAQMGLAESLPTHEGYELQKQMFPGSERTEHRSFVTEGGETEHVRRTREQGRGTALLGKQWETDWSRK